jgi:Tfp pilus assembly PilM family ATPase
LGMPVDSIEQVKIDISKYSQLNPGKFDGNLVALLMPVMDPIIKEIKYSLDLFITQSGNENKHMEKIILTGGAAALPHLADFISEQFKVKCYIGDPWARVVYQDGLKPILNEIGPRMSVAVGLALRNVL